MTSESTQLMAALPVRRRGTLEIFDTALKLYRRYFWVLIGWSALVSVFTTVLSCLAFLVTPFLLGAVSCCVAAAVRGQNVSFSQCWQFSKPRYGAMLGTLLLSGLVFLAGLFLLYIASAFIGVAGLWILSSAPEPVQVVVGIIGGIVLSTIYGVVCTLLYVWVGMVPIVACLEDDKRGSAALGRSFELLNGHWRRVFGMALILGLAMAVVFIIVGAVFVLLNAARMSELLNPTAANSDFWSSFLTFAAFFGIFYLVWNPAQFLITSVLYLDLRVRREALDLEWTAYTSAPLVPANGAMETPPIGAVPEFQSLGNPQPSSTETSPASFAAGSSLPPTETGLSGQSGGPVELTSPLSVEPQFVEGEFAETPFSNPTVTDAVPIAAEPAPVVQVTAEPVVASPSVASSPVMDVEPDFVDDENVVPFEIKPLDAESEAPPASSTDEVPGQDHA